LFGRLSFVSIIVADHNHHPRLPFPAGILRIPVFSVPVALFPQESGFLFRRKKKIYPLRNPVCTGPTGLEKEQS
jgi:hypothetical protein